MSSSRANSRCSGRSSQIKEPNDYIQPYNHSELFDNIHRIDFAEPFMVFNVEETDSIENADKYWKSVSNKVLDVENLSKKKAVKDKSKNSWFWRNLQ